MNLYNLKGEVIGAVELNPSVFNIEPNEHVVHELLVSELSSIRQGSSTKTRAEVRGGGRKPRRQKGTGAARQGSIRSVQWVGGGVSHGPNAEKKFDKKINKKARKLALRSILSSKVKSGNLYVLGDHDIEKPSTTIVKSFIDTLDLQKPLFMVQDIEGEEKLYYSARNIKDSSVIDTWDLAAYWLLKYENLILTKDALKTIEGILI